MKKQQQEDLALTDAFSVFQKKLSFLIDNWGFEEAEARDETYGCYFRYRKKGLLLGFSFDYRENFYYFDYQTKQGQESAAMLSFFLQKSAENNEKLNPEIFYAEKAGRMAALDNYIVYIKRYMEELLEMD